MASVTVSPEYQIVLPREVREQFNIQPGQELEILAYDGQLHIVPVEPIAALRGIFKGAEVPFEREKQDRLL
ncbi:MAG: AbrB/MazE/SpoVT family DNA-binding domain-containing protein [Methylococcales bacterium]